MLDLFIYFIFFLHLIESSDYETETGSTQA